MKKIVGIVLAFLLLTSCGTKKFDKEMNVAFASTIQTVVYSSIACGEISNTWHKAIYDHEGPNGRYCNDFNEAIKDISTILKDAGITDSIILYKNKMEKTTSKLNNPPNKRKDCYNDLIEMVSEVSQFASMATNPSGSLSSYNSQRNSIEENIMKELKKFEIKYSDIIAVKKLSTLSGVL